MAPRNRPPVPLSVVLFVFITGCLTGLAALYLKFVDVIPPRAMTLTAMGETSVRIGMYFQRSRCLPPDLSVLPIRENYVNRATDSDGQPLIYFVDSPNGFTLSSRRRQGAVGLTQHYSIVGGEVQPVP